MSDGSDRAAAANPAGSPSGRVIVASEYANCAQNSTGYFWAKAIQRLREDGMVVHTCTYTKEMSPRVRASVPMRALAKVQVAMRLAWLVLKEVRRGDVIFAGTNPEILLPLLAVIKTIRQAKLCVLVHDVFPENLVPAGVISPTSIVYKILSFLYRLVYQAFDATIVIGRDMQESVDRKAGRPGSVFIHNWVDAGEVAPADRLSSGLLTDLGWETCIVFQFFGNMGRLQGIPGLLDALGRCRSPRVAFLFAGEGVMRAQVADFCADHPRRYLLPVDSDLTRDEVLASCDVALVTLHRGMTGLGVPSKAYFSLAADRPLFALMEPEAEIARVVKEYGAGWTCSPADPQKVAALIDAVCEDLPVPSGRCRALIEGPLSKDAALAGLTRRIEELLA